MINIKTLLDIVYSMKHEPKSTSYLRKYSERIHLYEPGLDLFIYFLIIFFALTVKEYIVDLLLGPTQV